MCVATQRRRQAVKQDPTTCVATQRRAPISSPPRQHHPLGTDRPHERRSPTPPSLLRLSIDLDPHRLDRPHPPPSSASRSTSTPIDLINLIKTSSLSLNRTGTRSLSSCTPIIAPPSIAKEYKELLGVTRVSKTILRREVDLKLLHDCLDTHNCPPT
ncbi:hypothetical protein BCR34DRAFT_87304 [Clohesyomyces aquaticus]|uniref:Uncharacterized protein n=1 Tax=Clohesyomyces aquaticus TaxID=1231657 RepID=A0A1Y2A315_9PLEO|nr:hypothetical protein BCR34DRAFT_87304 [Clohesyomyces aquaticus]